MAQLPRVLICTDLHEKGLRILEKIAAVDVRPNLAPAEIQQRIPNYHGLVVDPGVAVTHDIIEEGLSLRVIGCAGARLDNIDVTTARAMGIRVVNVPSGNAVAIAEHTMRHLLIAASQFSDPTRPERRAGLAGRTLGIIGFGRVGRQVAQRALAFDMNVIANQPRLTPELALDPGVVTQDLNELLSTADFVTLHVPFKPETDALIGAEELALLHPHATLVNIGHTDLVSDSALLEALEKGGVAGAVVPSLPDGIDVERSEEQEAASRVRSHPNVIVAPHITTVLGARQRSISLSIARRVADIVAVQKVDESLALEIVPVEAVNPHEKIDEKRVSRLMARLKKENKLINPPIVTQWRERYVILDGATRFTALSRLGYPFVAAQIVDARRGDYELHTWYHVISRDRTAAGLFEHLEQINGLILERVEADRLPKALQEEGALCYFLDSEGEATLARAKPAAGRLEIMNQVVDRYSAWGLVERTLVTELARLKAQFPEMVALAVFPQFEPEKVFENAIGGQLLPAGLTRFVIPGRILRLNLDLEKLQQEEPLAVKRAWFNRFLAEKLARSRLRYYEEPVILLDE